MCPDLWEVGLEEYLALGYHSEDSFGNVPLFRWDNFGPIFLTKYSHLIDKCVFVTHGKGDKPRTENIIMPAYWKLPCNIDFWLEDSDKWICDVDLDYFFYQSGDSSRTPLFSDEYIEQLFTQIAKLIANGKIIILTIALSPECCGTWEAAESMCNRVCEILGLDFKILDD